MTAENIIMTSLKTQWAVQFGGQLIDEWKPIEDSNVINTNTINYASRIRLGINIKNKLNQLAVLTDVSYYEVYIDIRCIGDTSEWSGLIDLTYFFVNGGYTPPAPAIGDTIQIDSIELLTISEPEYHRGPSTAGTRRATIAVLYHYF